VELASSVGRWAAGKYTFSLADWAALERAHPNPKWWKREFIRELTCELDAQPGGPDQAERIRDAQIAAIDAACHLFCPGGVMLFGKNTEVTESP
jgi:hypothetical protein